MDYMVFLFVASENSFFDYLTIWDKCGGTKIF